MSAFDDNVDRLIWRDELIAEMLAEIKQASVELEEAANILAGTGYAGLGSIYKAAAQKKRDLAAKAEERS